MRISITLFLIVFFSFFALGNRKYNFFESLKGEFANCNAHRFDDIKVMIDLKNFAALKNIYPKVSKKDLRSLQKISVQIDKLLPNYRFNRGIGYGANLIEYQDSSLVEYSSTFLSRKNGKIHLLHSFTVVVEKEVPYLIDTIIFHKRFPFDKDVQHDLEKQNYKPYPPIPRRFNCFSSPEKYGLSYEKGNPVLRVTTELTSYYDYKFEEYLMAMERLNLPIILSNAILADPLDSLVSFEIFKEAEFLNLHLSHPTFLTRDLAKNESIGYIFINLRPNVTDFILPKDLIQMKELKYK